MSEMSNTIIHSSLLIRSFLFHCSHLKEHFASWPTTWDALARRSLRVNIGKDTSSSGDPPATTRFVFERCFDIYANALRKHLTSAEDKAQLHSMLVETMMALVAAPNLSDRVRFVAEVYLTRALNLATELDIDLPDEHRKLLATVSGKEI